MAIIFDYFRPGLPVSLRPGGFPCVTALKPEGRRRTATVLAGALLAVLPAAAQYAGKVPESPKKNGPDLRAVAVLEWTGDPGKPKASRLVPITLWDGQDLQDASIYMAQPEPLALQSEVEYKLEQNGKTIGYYDISSAGQSQGTWIGFGSWKPLTSPKPAAPPQKIEEAGDDNGPPILHRKNQPDKSSGKSSAPAPAPDPDRPTLHAPAKPSKPAAEKPHSDEGYSEPIASAPDPDRPHLFHGKASSTGGEVLPTLAGLPPEMHQTVAVSDAGNHPDHDWTYSWANPDDAAKMKSELEDLARKALAPPPPPEPAKAAPRRRTATARRSTKPAPPPPMPLKDEQFHVFQLTYGGPATMVFSAHTQVPAAPAADTADEIRPPVKPGAAGKASDADESRPPLKTGAGDKVSGRGETSGKSKTDAAGKVSDAGEAGVAGQTGATPEKFITLIAQPDLYGNVRVLFKNIADASSLDDNPAMRLIDPVDAMADNRGELLFELRGATQRQFALYRVISGRVEKLFTTSPESVAMPVAPPPAS